MERRKLRPVLLLAFLAALSLDAACSDGSTGLDTLLSVTCEEIVAGTGDLPPQPTPVCCQAFIDYCNTIERCGVLNEEESVEECIGGMQADQVKNALVTDPITNEPIGLEVTDTGCALLSFCLAEHVSCDLTPLPDNDPLNGIPDHLDKNLAQIEACIRMQPSDPDLDQIVDEAIFSDGLFLFALPSPCRSGESDPTNLCYDNCPSVPNGDCYSNPDFCDANGDGTIDSAEFANGFQNDSDGDGRGDACDLCPGGDDGLDGDGDGFPDDCDDCPTVFDIDQTDSDGDGRGDLCDPCPNDANDAC